MGTIRLSTFTQVPGRVAVKNDLSWSCEEAICSHSGRAGAGGNAGGYVAALESSRLPSSLMDYFVNSFFLVLLGLFRRVSECGKRCVLKGTNLTAVKT